MVYHIYVGLEWYLYIVC